MAGGIGGEAKASTPSVLAVTRKSKPEGSPAPPGPVMETRSKNCPSSPPVPNLNQ